MILFKFYKSKFDKLGFVKLLLFAYLLDVDVGLFIH